MSWRLPSLADCQLRGKQLGHMGRGGARFLGRRGVNLHQIQDLPAKVCHLLVWCGTFVLSKRHFSSAMNMLFASWILFCS